MPILPRIALVAAWVPCACVGPRVVQAPGPAADDRYVVQARADSAVRPYVRADIDFMTAMIPHHAQALAMARLAPANDASASVKTLCARIINAQQDEIGLMQGWLRDRRLPVPEARPTGLRMEMDGMEHDMLMPGMLSADQMKQLQQARGKEFDRLFLVGMIQHHKGAVAMVTTLLSHSGAAQDRTVFKFSNDVQVDQSTEIARMELMLAALTSTQRNNP